MSHLMGRLRRLVQVLLHLEDTPHRIALAFAIGVWIAFCPLVGFHTLLALAVGFSLRLSRAALLIGAYLTNPWTIAPLFGAGTALGCWLLGVPMGSLGELQARYLADAAGALRGAFAAYLWPFVLGNLLVGTLGGILAYFVLRSVLERRRTGTAQAASGGAAS